ncbi:MAG: hypothetical protein G8D91_09230 [gamma proteobacterium symbiont of Clathrolucina costata]
MYEEQIKELNWYKDLEAKPKKKIYVLNGLFNGHSQLMGYHNNMEWDDELMSDIMDGPLYGQINMIEGFEDWGQLVHRCDSSEDKAMDEITMLVAEMISMAFQVDK